MVDRGTKAIERIVKASSEVEQIGRDIALAVVGEGVIDEVEVRSGWTSSDEPSYQFFFRIDPERVPFRPGLIHIRLSQGLQEALDSRGDTHVAIVHLLSPDDWRRWADA